MPIEELVVEYWTTESADLTGQPTFKSEPVHRLVCSYFPPHTSWSRELLESGSEYLTLSDWSGSEQIDTADGPFRVSQALEVKLDNGGAMYLLGVLDEDGNREGRLWKLIEGRSSG